MFLITHESWGIVATYITIFAYLPYILSILKGTTKPNRTTWVVLFLIGLVSFITYKDIGATTTLGVPLANVIGPLIIFVLSIKFGEGWETLNDFKYLLISGVAIVLWQIYDSPLLGLIFNLFADFIAFIPTLKKSFFKPQTENTLTWCLFSFGGILNLLAIDKWIFSIIVYPLYILIAESTVAFLLLRSHFKICLEKINVK